MDEVHRHRSGKRLGCRLHDQHTDRFPGRSTALVFHLPVQRDLLTAPSGDEDTPMMKYRYSIALAASMMAAAVLAACTRDDLLGISTPDAITPGNLNSADGAEGLRVGA